MIFALMGPIYAVMGLSLMVYSGQWSKVIKMYKDNHLVFLPFGFLAMLIGIVFLNMYREWTSDVYVIATLFGWLAFLKGALYMLVPGKMITGWIGKFESKGCLQVMGLICLALGTLLSYHAYLA